MNIQEIERITFEAGQWPLDPEKPTLIFIHGAALSKTCWRLQLEALSGHVNTIALDLPGHGESRSPGKNTISDYAESVCRFVEAMDPPTPVLCGLSMGGAIVQQLLLLEPHPFKGGILINTGSRLKVMPLIFDTIKKNYGKFVESACALGISPENDTQELRVRLTAAFQCDPDTALGDFEACDRFNLTGRLDALTRPVLVLTAENDMITPVKYGSYLKESIARSQWIHIEGAGHLSPMEKPEEVSRAILAFLDPFL